MSKDDTNPIVNGETNHGTNNEEETDSSTKRNSSGGFPLQPSLEQGPTDSLDRDTHCYFDRQRTKPPVKPSPLINSSLNAVPEDDGEATQDGKLEVILQSSNGATTPANATPPVLRPQALIIKQKSTEPAQQ